MMNSDLDDLPTLRVADFGLPVVPELPGGMLSFGDVLLWPGVNGLFDAEGRLIEESCLRRGIALRNYPNGRPGPLDPTQVALASAAEPLERIAYLPFARMDHFGHILTEFAGHVGGLLEDPRGLDGVAGGRSVLVVSARCHAASGPLADLLGLPADRVLSTADLSGPTRAREALIPRPSMINRHGIAARHFRHVWRVLDRLHGVGPHLANLAAASGRARLYLSRSRLPPGVRRIREEKVLEDELRRLGWRVAHPQELSIAEQLDHLADARTIAGCVGSALHLLMAFGERAGGRRMIALGSGVKQTGLNLVLQASRQGMPFRQVVCLEADPDSPETNLNRRMQRFTTSPDRIARCLERLAVEPLE